MPRVTSLLPNGVITSRHTPQPLGRHCEPAIKGIAGAPRVSTSEHALLEVLSEMGVRQALQEAHGLAESAYSLRADVLFCSSVKTVRLCLQFGRKLALPWAAKLDASQLPTGSARSWVSRSADGLLVLKP